MNKYNDPELMAELAQFHLMIGKRFEDDADYTTLSSVVAKLLRCEVGLVLVKLTRSENKAWENALMERRPEYAAEQGWMLSGEIPRALKEEFGPQFDYETFAAFWRDEVPSNVVVDIDRDFAPGSEKHKGKTWTEHIVRYLHHVPMFYREAA